MCQERRTAVSNFFKCFYGLIKMNKALTIDNLYGVKNDSKVKDNQSVTTTRCFLCRVDVFDRYTDNSIKASTRQRRTKTTKPIRRVIVSRDTPLPFELNKFTTLSENKTDMTMFFSNELIRHAPDNKTIVVGGSFLEEQQVAINMHIHNLDSLRATHEEEDTHHILHASHCETRTVVGRARDTDVLVLLICYTDQMRCDEVWMEAGTSKNQKFIPEKQVYAKIAPELSHN